MLKIIIFVCLLVYLPQSLADNGLIQLKSHYNFEQTIQRFEKILSKKGVHIFAKIDHAGAAKNIGQVLLPTTLIIFGKPQMGTRLMQCDQRIGIDLPLKALIWQDQNHTIWFAYNAPEYLAKRHDMKNCRPQIQKISKILSRLAHKVTGSK